MNDQPNRHKFFVRRRFSLGTFFLAGKIQTKSRFTRKESRGNREGELATFQGVKIWDASYEISANGQTLSRLPLRQVTNRVDRTFLSLAI
jgi:hypothetical protein